PERIVRLLNALQDSALVATTGQHRDLLAEQRTAQEPTEEECITIARQKAGAIMRLACQLGALCAEADETLCEQFSELGELLGISHQLDNDAHDLYDLLHSQNPVLISDQATISTGSIKTDLIREKKTLPVVLAASKEVTIQKSSSVVDEEKNEEYQRT